MFITKFIAKLELKGYPVTKVLCCIHCNKTKIVLKVKSMLCIVALHNAGSSCCSRCSRCITATTTVEWLVGRMYVLGSSKQPALLTSNKSSHLSGFAFVDSTGTS